VPFEGAALRGLILENLVDDVLFSWQSLTGGMPLKNQRQLMEDKYAFDAHASVIVSMYGDESANRGVTAPKFERPPNEIQF
jgi:hypothetical protein